MKRGEYPANVQFIVSPAEETLVIRNGADFSIEDVHMGATDYLFERTGINQWIIAHRTTISGDISTIAEIMPNQNSKPIDLKKSMGFEDYAVTEDVRFFALRFVFTYALTGKKYAYVKTISATSWNDELEPAGNTTGPPFYFNYKYQFREMILNDQRLIYGNKEEDYRP
jgi:hypothetical protein